MFASNEKTLNKGSRKPESRHILTDDDNEQNHLKPLTGRLAGKQLDLGILKDVDSSNDQYGCYNYDESEQFLSKKDAQFYHPKSQARPQLARAETIGSDDDDYSGNGRGPFERRQSGASTGKTKHTGHSHQQLTQSGSGKRDSSCCGSCKMICRILARKAPILIALLILSCMAAIYCIPFVEIDPRTPKSLPNIPFNFNEGPLRASSVEAFKIEHLFYNQIHGAESIALDSVGNMYMAIEGGFVLYAHLNASSKPNKAYYSLSGASSRAHSYRADDSSYLKIFNNNQNNTTTTSATASEPYNLIKIAELNAVKQLPYEQRRPQAGESNWRRECQSDEKVYGKELWYKISMGRSEAIEAASNELPSQPSQFDRLGDEKFVSRVGISRCSKPLGIRLSPDEKYLYIIDTLSGLYRVHLNVSDRQQSSQRLVTKLVDFRSSRGLLLPIHYLDLAAGVTNIRRETPVTTTPTSSQLELLQEAGIRRQKTFLNVTLRAVDDLVIDYGAGSRGSDIIYMTLGSQNWNAVSFVYDMLEGRPSGLILRYDTGANQLAVLSPVQISHVRTSILGISSSVDFNKEDNTANSLGERSEPSLKEPVNKPPEASASKPEQMAVYSEQVFGIGAPRLDENDIFDDRPLFFPNGIELTDNRQALLIADTANKRIIKHYIQGPRKGTSDLWAWTPNYPDNIRRGYDKGQETYWVVGCGHDTTNTIDPMKWLHSWPMLRKYILKNMYIFGYLIEQFGSHIIHSESIRDFGYGIKTGHSVCQSMCSGMMILQYNLNGDIIRSIYSKEFPSDLSYYSQVSEIIDRKQQQHILYLGSPSYTYVTKLSLPYQIV